MSRIFHLGTRKSPLAMAQSQEIARSLCAAHGWSESRIHLIPIDTKYYAGGKKLNYWIAALSARSTGESGWLLLGVTGMGAVMGVSAFWIVIGEVLGVFLSWHFMAEKFKILTDKYDSITVPDFLHSHFNSKNNTIRIIGATALSVFVVIYVSAQIDITGKTFESFLGYNYYNGILIGFGIVIAYIFSGGFLAVAWSDLFQGSPYT